VREHVISTRWTDFDALGHLTHAAYPVFLDEARDAYLSATVGSFADWPCVVAHVSIDYRLEIRYPAASVTVRTAVAEIGRTSVTFSQDVVGPDGRVAASGTGVVVAFDPERRSARPLDDSERARLAE
jgi:YbgC/YbaW family acyl-CoA thioester hydrolase